MRNIVFIALQLSQPRCIKRIKSIAEAGIPIKIYGFDSGLYNDNLKNLPFEITRLIKRDKNIGKIKKIESFAKIIKGIIKENNQDDIFYLFGFEITSIAFLVGCKNYIYEEADVTVSRIKNTFLKNILLSYDRTLYRKAKLVVNTSEGFSKYIFKKKSYPNNIVLLPNKLHPSFSDDIRNAVNKTKIDINHIKFGFVGLIRYPNTIIRFAKVIGKFFPNHEFHFFGQPERENYIDEEIKSYKNVVFHGKFKNPDDLQRIYENIDINIVCYDTASDNVKIAEPNKLYESIFFNTPIVVSKDTFLSKKVTSYKVGYSINCSNNDEIKSFVNNITLEDINRIQSFMKDFVTSDLIDTPENLINRISSFI